MTTEKPDDAQVSEEDKQKEAERRAEQRRSRESDKHFQGHGTEKRG